MKRILCFALTVFVLLTGMLLYTSAATTHTVKKGDTMWKIAVTYEVGLSELKAANPQIANPDLIYPDQILNIPVRDTAVSNFESEVIRLVNLERTKRGLSPLAADWQLSRVARYKSQDMYDNRYFSHTSPVYGSPFEMIRSFGISYRSAGENIAKGQRSPAAVVSAWMYRSISTGNLSEAEHYHVTVCNECGCCTWVCPARIPILQNIRIGKDMLRAKQQKR